MPGNPKTVEIAELILKLFNEQQEVSIRSIARAAGLPEDADTARKTIQRALISLAKRKMIVSQGSGRARVYVRPAQASPGVKEQAIFGDIPLTPESRALLHHVSQSIQARVPVGYVQDFLRSYQPNKTFYLSEGHREDLRSVGRVETQVRPAGTYARNILSRLLIDLSWNSSRLEGNTYSLLETKRLIELGEAANGKDAAEAQMILNHKAAIEYVVDSSTEESISTHGLCSIHALLSENLLGDPSASGRIRQIAVGIGGTTYLPIENPHALRECFDLFVDKVNRIADPFEQSLFSLVHLSYMQAFEDVNKRTARLVANISLIKKNLKPLSFIDVEPNAYVKALLGIYEKNDICLIRDLYIWAYNRSAQRYTAIQQTMGAPNLLKLKYRAAIQEIIRAIILEKVDGSRIVQKIKNFIEVRPIPDPDQHALFNVIETEILSLHEGNIARFKIRPSEFQAWRKLQ